MDYFKKHPGVRMIIILASFVVALFLVISGWKMTGEMSGLITMIAGVALLLVALAVYNKPFEDPKKK